MPKPDYMSLPLPELPHARFVARGYYTSAYYVVEPDAPSGAGNVAEPDDVEQFDPELEPDYFLEHGYPEPEPAQKEPEEQKTIVLCHGLAANGLQFVADAHFFAAQGFRVIVPDLRGHGRSKTPDKKLRRDEDFTIEQMAADLVEVLDAERVEKAHWVGNSLGGILALSLMGSHPERLSGFVCFGTSFSMDLPLFSIKLMQFASRLVRREHLAQIGARTTSFAPEAQAIIYAMLKQADRDCVVRVARQARKYDFIENALGFERPMLVLLGERDRAIHRALAPTLAAMNERSYFFTKEVANAGHCVNLDQPEIFREAILDFVGGGWIFEE